MGIRARTTVAAIASSTHAEKHAAMLAHPSNGAPLNSSYWIMEERRSLALSLNKEHVPSACPSCSQPIGSVLLQIDCGVHFRLNNLRVTTSFVSGAYILRYTVRSCETRQSLDGYSSAETLTRRSYSSSVCTLSLVRFY